MYQIESMQEINELSPNGYNMVSTFSGCGGSCLGFKMAGFKVLWANEFIPAAQDTYRLNHPNTYLDTRDIRQVTASSILDRIGLKKGELDVFEGSPPCASFSTYGKVEKGWGCVKKYSDHAQRCDDLFYEYIRLLKGLSPKVFIAENVKGLVQGKAKGYFKDIMGQLKECGYNVSAKVLNAKWLGVPQNRERLIFIGVRKDLDILPVHPRPHIKLVMVKDALLNVINTEHDIKIAKKTCATAPILKLWHNTKRGHRFNEVHPKGHFFGWQRLSWTHQSQTIVQSSTVIFHPDDPRLLTIPELKRIGSFPDDFKLTGTFGQQWERIGRAVPPLMAKAIAETIRDEILQQL